RARDELRPARPHRPARPAGPRGGVGSGAGREADAAPRHRGAVRRPLRRRGARGGPDLRASGRPGPELLTGKHRETMNLHRTFVRAALAASLATAAAFAQSGQYLPGNIANTPAALLAHQIQGEYFG